MAFFSDIEEMFDLYMSELPEDMFASDRADDADPAKRSVSSSEIRATATVLQDAEDNLSEIYDNKFASYANAQGMTRWEKDYFSEAVDTSIGLTNRRSRLLAKIRANGGISYTVINDIVSGVFVGSGLTYQLVAWCGTNGGAWILDESALDVETYLSDTDPLYGVVFPNPLDCNHDYVAAGLTLEQFEGILKTAYRYEVRIFGNASSDLIARLDKVLTESEPARSDHIILNNFPGAVAP